MTFMESLMESVDGEGNPNWLRDFLIAVAMMILAASAITSFLAVVGQ